MVCKEWWSVGGSLYEGQSVVGGMLEGWSVRSVRGAECKGWCLKVECRGCL